jgi:hypothetical protein
MAIEEPKWKQWFQEVLDSTGGTIGGTALSDAVMQKYQADTGSTVARGTVDYWRSRLLESQMVGGTRRYFFRGAGAVPATAPSAQTTTPTVAVQSPPAGPEPVAEQTVQAEKAGPVQAPPQAPPEPEPVPDVPPSPPLTPEEVDFVLPEGVRIEEVKKYNGDDTLFEGSYWMPRDVGSDAYSQKWTVIWKADPRKKAHPYGDTWDVLIPTEVATKQYTPQLIGTPSPIDPKVGTDVWLLQQMFEPKQEPGHPFTEGPGPVLMMGHSGTGKTHSVFAALGDPKLDANKRAMNGARPWEAPRVYRAIMSSMTPEQIIGQWIPNENASPDKTGKVPAFVWVDGVLTKMVRYGGTFIADELNMTSADVLAAVNSLLDDQHFLTLTQRNGEIVPAHPKFWFIGAGNPVGPGYIAVKPLNIALRSRFSMVFWYIWNTKYEEKTYPPHEMIGQIRNEWVHRMFGDLRTAFLPGRVHYPVSSRDMGHFFKLLKLGDRTGAGPSPAFISLVYLFETIKERNLVKGIISNIIPANINIQWPSESTEE